MSGDDGGDKPPLMPFLLKLPPNVLERMGFQRPPPQADVGASDTEIAAQMLKPLLFGGGDGSTASGAVGTEPESIQQQQQQALEESRRRIGMLSPAENFSLRHPSGPKFFVRDGFLGAEAAARVRDAVVALHRGGALRPAKMGRGQSKVRVCMCAERARVRCVSGRCSSASWRRMVPFRVCVGFVPTV